MSHFTKVSTRIVDEPSLRHALSQAGYTVPPGRATIGGWNGQSREVTVGIPNVIDNYGIGFDWEQSRSCFSSVADWSELHVRGFDRSRFLRNVTQLYGVEVTTRTMTPQGYALIEQTTQHDGSIRILMRRVS